MSTLTFSQETIMELLNFLDGHVIKDDELIEYIVHDILKLEVDPRYDPRNYVKEECLVEYLQQLAREKEELVKQGQEVPESMKFDYAGYLQKLQDKNFKLV